MPNGTEQEWRFTWRTTWPDVWKEEFLSPWNEMLQQASFSHVYHRPEVVRAWAETRGAALGAQPMIGLAANRKGCRVLLPWVVVAYRGKFFRRQVLEPVGQSLFGYHDPLVTGDNPDAIGWISLWETLRRTLRNACDQALFRFVHARYGHGRRGELCAEQSPLLNLRGKTDFAGILARCSQNHRGDVRRRLRRLTEQGDVRLWVAKPTDVSAMEADFHEHFVPAYNTIWNTRPVGSMLAQPGLIAFLTRVVTEGVHNGWGHYVSLRVNDRPIAWHLGLLDRGSLYWWIPTHDPTWEHFSPGKVLLAKLIEYGITARWSQIHFLTGGHPYKLAWRPDALDLRTIRWYAPSLRGKMLTWYDRCRQRTA